MYTSGWPKNHRMCWYSTGSPPPAGLKKLVPKLRSISSMVMAPASTGRASRISQAVMKTDQANSGTLNSVMPGARIFRKVVMMLIAPRIEDAPETWTAKIARSIEYPASVVDSGGYRTQPTPEPIWSDPPGDSRDATPSATPATYIQ